uniref:transposase n=1 Tax=Belnapia arida TaxID=2804533 RepID=UPI0038B2794B
MTLFCRQCESRYLQGGETPADVVGIFPSKASMLRLIGAVLLEADDEWQLQHRYMGTEAMAEILTPAAANDTPQLPPKVA